MQAGHGTLTRSLQNIAEKNREEEKRREEKRDLAPFGLGGGFLRRSRWRWYRNLRFLLGLFIALGFALRHKNILSGHHRKAMLLGNSVAPPHPSPV